MGGATLPFLIRSDNVKDFKKSTIYQIYPKSFYDSDNDGVGDLNGIKEKLPYLADLGVDFIWITPFYVSPGNDNGYDVADYKNIDPKFGTMKDFEELIKKSKEYNIEIMLDMVFNHSSTEHEWFKKAITGDQHYKDYYIFKNPIDGREPTNWISKFGGSAWEYVEELDEYYLSLFDKTQADLNWDNPNVRREIYKVVNFWLDKGVKGFRLDVINLISKPEVFEDDHIGDGRRFYTDGPKVHQYLKDLNANTFGKRDGIITVGEMSSTDIKNCIKYSNPDENELTMTFNFHHLKVDYKDGEKWSLMDFDFIELKNILNDWQIGMNKGDGWNALFWSNHDQPRIVSRFGNDKTYHKESAKMLATTIHMMKGTPYIYQGEEIGMTDPYFDKIKDYRDVESINYYQILKEQGIEEEEIIKILQSKSRDNSRTPMTWNDDNQSGFTKCDKSWISVNNNYNDINVKRSMEDVDSIYYHYKKLIALRKEYNIIAYGDYIPILKGHKNIFSYLRTYRNEILLVINNFYGENTTFHLPDLIHIEEWKINILISNYKDSTVNIKEIELRPYESIVYHLESL